MYAVLAEGHSDALMLRTIIERLGVSFADSKPRVKEKGYNGCGELMKHGARDLKALSKLGYTRFVVCFDADQGCPERKRSEVLQRIFRPASIPHPVCALVPVQEIEAWILADLDSLGRLFPTWRGRPAPIASPENVRNPKEHLKRLTQDAGGRPKYDHANHNQHIAHHLDLNQVQLKCPSFSPLVDLVRTGSGNCT